MVSNEVETFAGPRPSAADAMRRLIHGASWNLVAVSFSQGVTFATNVLIARSLGREAFGQYAVVQGMLVTAIGVLQTSMGGTAAKYVAELRNSRPELAGAIIRLCGMLTLVMSCLGGLLMAGGAQWIATAVYRAPQLVFGFYAGSVFLLFSTLNGFQMGVLSGLESYRSLGFASATSGLASLLVLIVAVWKFGLPGAFIALGAGALIRWSLHALSLRSALKKSKLLLKKVPLATAFPTVLRFAVPSTLIGYVSLPALWAPVALLARQSGGFGQMGSYAAATNIRLLVLFLPQVLNTVGISILNNHRHGAPAAYRLVHRSNIFVMAAANLAMAFVVLLTSRTVLSIFGKDFTGDSAVVWILLASTVPECISIGLHQHLQTQEQMWRVLLWISLPRETLVLVAAFLLVPSHGARGLAFAYLLGTLLALTSYTILVHRGRPVATSAQL